MNIPTITVMDESGAALWSGSLTQFARDNGRDVAQEVIGQWRNSIRVNGQLEPAFIGGGAAPEFMVLM